MSVEQMRHRVAYDTKYSKSRKWIDKVFAMSDSQIIAIYHRILGSDGFTNYDDGEQLCLSVIQQLN